MKVLFVLEDNFPKSGACTSLLNNILYEGGLLKKVSIIDVLAVKSSYTQRKKEIANKITVHNCVLISKVPTCQYKRALFKHPFKLLAVVAEKMFSVPKTDLIGKVFDTRNSKEIKKSLRDIKPADYDAIIAVVGRFDVAVATMEYKRENPAAKLLIYQVDPCSSNEMYSSSVKEKLSEFEKEMYLVSDGIITTPILLEESKLKYPKDIVDKMTPMEFPNVVPFVKKHKSDSSKIRCLFAGSIYGDFRNPDYTLKLFDEVISEVSFEMIGAVKPAVKETFNSHKVLYHGSMSLEETKSQLASADILVNIGNRMLNQVPSKIFEYISYGKPIINICKNRNCPTLPYLEKYPYALNLFEEDEIFEEQVSLLNEFILNNYKNRMPPDEISRVFETCTPQYCAKQMLDVLKDICK